VTERYDGFWAEFLGITPAELNLPGLSIAEHVGLQGYRGVWCFRRGDRTVVSAPPGWLPHLQGRLPEIGQDHLMEESVLREVFGSDFDRLVGPAYQGYLLPDRFRPYVAPHVRFLEPEEAALVEAFRVECGQDAWEYAGFNEATSYLAAIREDSGVMRQEALAFSRIEPTAVAVGQPLLRAPLSGARSKKERFFSIRHFKPTRHPSGLPGGLDTSNTPGMWRYG